MEHTPRRFHCSYICEQKTSDNVHEHRHLFVLLLFSCGTLLLLATQYYQYYLFQVDKPQQEDKGFCICSSHVLGYSLEQRWWGIETVSTFLIKTLFVFYIRKAWAYYPFAGYPSLEHKHKHRHAQMQPGSQPAIGPLEVIYGSQQT